MLGTEINTKEIITEWEKDIKTRIDKLKCIPQLNIIKVGSREESKLYVNNKIKKSKKLGIDVHLIEFPEDVTQDELNEALRIMNKPTILQLPLPEHLNAEKALENLCPECDVDGLTVYQKGLLAEGRSEAFVPATAAGVIKLIESVREIKGRKVAIISRSELIGKPLVNCILQKDGYPVILHSKVAYHRLKTEMRTADIIVTGCGKRAIFGAENVSVGQVIIDCSMASKEGINGVGDFDKEDVLLHTKNTIASGFGHTGPATVMGLMENVIKYYELY